MRDNTHNSIVVSFRGTANFKDLIVDLVSWPGSVLDSYAHDGTFTRVSH